jgi:hypothetical protein
LTVQALESLESELKGLVAMLESPDHTV